MLEVALKLRAAFELLELQDDKYKNELNKSHGLPTDNDWAYVKSILPFLEIFYDATLRISGSLYVTSNKYMKEVFSIGRKMKMHCEDPDLSIRLMASKMQRKYDKYWGTPNAINMLLLIAIVLDPCHKLDFVNWILDESFSAEKGGELESKLLTCLNSLYNHYQGKEDESQSNQDAMINEEDEDDILNIYLQSIGRNSDAKSELDRYLKEDCEPKSKSARFDILGWWKGNSTRFPILARKAWEVLAIPVSTVPSESAFSTDGRIIGPYRSSLTPHMVEVLVCSQDWVMDDPLGLVEDFEGLENAEKGRSSSTSVGGHISLEDD